MRRGTRWGVAGLGGAALAAAVAITVIWPSGGPERATAASPRAKPLLREVGTCAALARHIRRVAPPRTGAWGLSGLGVTGVPVAVSAPGLPVREAAPVAGDGATRTVVTAGAPAFSGTNVQEAGVDEPDLVKTDGSRIFALSGDRLQALEHTGDSARRVGSLRMPAVSPSEMLLVGDRLLVIGTPAGRPGIEPPLGPAAAIAIAPWSARTSLVLVDVSDPSRMRVRERMTLDAAYVSARMTGSTVRLVTSSVPVLPLTSPRAATTAAMARAAAHNRRVMRRVSPRRWLPRYELLRAGVGRRTGRVVGCDDVSRPARFAGLGMVEVLTLDPGRGLAPVDSDAVMTDGQHVYASPNSLYVATPRWWDPDRATAASVATSATVIHRFDIRDRRRTEHVASGGVPGFPLNQFSFSEHEGDLRVATTEAPSWWGDASRLSESRVTVLRAVGSRLVPRGAVTGLGRGERIYAVRFVGDRGYVVTFREVDPLYVLDLGDPSTPRVRGELKITGYSAYLHPVGEHRLIGIGRDADLEGRVSGVQVSLFDVSDAADPRRVARHLLGDGRSESEFEHRAVLHWPATGLLALPFTRYSGSAATGAEALRVGGASIAPIRRIAHPVAGFRGAIRRSLVIGGTLYTVSTAGILASDAATAEDRDWIPFG